MFVSRIAKAIITTLYWVSPYSWFDEWLKHKELESGRSETQRKHIRNQRYLFSEIYIVGWILLAMAVLAFGCNLPVLVAYLLLFRVVGILNKELGVALFGICKITEGKKVSSSGRVILLALLNYLTAGLLFSYAYSKIGEYYLDNGSISGLSVHHALIQAFSVHFTLQPAYRPVGQEIWILVFGHSAFCFLFGTIILSLFVSLIQLGPTFDD